MKSSKSISDACFPLSFTWYCQCRGVFGFEPVVRYYQLHMSKALVWYMPMRRQRYSRQEIYFCSQVALLSLEQWFPRPRASASPVPVRNANFRTYPRFTESGTLRVGTSNLCFKKPSRWLWYTLKFEGHCFKARSYILPASVGSKKWWTRECSHPLPRNAHPFFAHLSLLLCQTGSLCW